MKDDRRERKQALAADLNKAILLRNIARLKVKLETQLHDACVPD